MPALFAAANSHYRWLLTSDPEQLAYFRGPAVADLDDPKYSRQELALLRRPNLIAYVVTDRRAAERYQELGLEKPFHVIPHGVSLDELSDAKVAAVRDRYRVRGRIVVGYIASWLLSEGDRGGESAMYNIDHLLDLWPTIRAKAPHAQLWLVGQPSERVRRRCAADPEIVLFGRVPQGQHLAYVANFDIALYPRTKDEGIRAVKVAEYMAAGVPTVAYDYRVTSQLRETRAGLLVHTPSEFVDSVELLTKDANLRKVLALNASNAGADLNWRRLAQQYEALLDSYFV